MRDSDRKMKSIALVVLIDIVMFAVAGMVEAWSPISLGWIWAGVATVAVVLLMFWKKILQIVEQLMVKRGTPRLSETESVNTADDKSNSVSESAPMGAPTTVVSASSESSSVEALSPESRVYTPRTASEIFESIHELTSLETERFTRPYIGMWLRIEGDILNVYGHTDIVSLSVETPEIQDKYLGMKQISLCFDKGQWLQHFETAKKGDSVLAVGKFKTIDRWEIVLEDCELI